MRHAKQATKWVFVGLLGGAIGLSHSARAEIPYEGGDAGGNGGGYFDDPCPARFLKGLAVRTGATVDQVKNRCYDSDGNLYNEATAHGGNGGVIGTMTCKTGHVVQGFHGRANAEVDALGLTCVEEVDVEGVADPGTQTRSSVAAKGGNGGAYFSFRCASGDAASGIYGRSGARVDQIGVWCLDVALSY